MRVRYLIDNSSVWSNLEIRTTQNENVTRDFFILNRLGTQIHMDGLSFSASFLPGKFGFQFYDTNMIHILKPSSIKKEITKIVLLRF